MKNQMAIIIAVALGLLAVIGVRAHLKSLEKDKAKEIRKVTVVVAKRDIEKGDALTVKNTTSGSVSVEALQGMDLITFSERETYINRYWFHKKVPKGSFITKEMLLRVASRSMSSELSPSERAITIPVDQVSGVSGYVSPGDHVDIFATFTVPAPVKAGERRADIKTYLLLSNVRVLRTGMKTTPTRRRRFASKSTTYTTVTLRVNKEQAHVLAFAQAQGRLTLALRPPGDQTKPSRNMLDLHEIIKLLEKG